MERGRERERERDAEKVLKKTRQRQMTERKINDESCIIRTYDSETEIRHYTR